MNLLTLFALSHFITFNEFSNFSVSKQYSYLAEHIDTDSQVVKKVSGSSDLDSKYLSLYTESKKQVDELYFEANYYHSVGGFELTYSILLSSDNEVLGFEVKVFQAGCMYLEDNPRHGGGGHFNTKEEAELDSCSTDADVSWTAYMVFDYEGKLIEDLSDDYFEWTGH